MKQTLELGQRFAMAWSEGDADGMAALFAPDGTYTDNAFQAHWTGRDAVADWVRLSHSKIDGIRVTASAIFGDETAIAVVSTFSGHMRGAPHAFSVPMTSVLTLRGAFVTSATDTYNVAVVFKQSGLPADFDPTATG